MAECGLCGKRSPTVSGTLGFCAACIRNRFQEVWPAIRQVHHRTRIPFGLPVDAPAAPRGASCGLCLQHCRIPEGRTGYCGLRHNRRGKICGGRAHEGNLAFYHDPLPTNCVADEVCPGGTGSGYPRFAHREQAEYGYRNLAVFYRACAFNCLFCQNAHFKEYTLEPSRVRAAELAAAVEARTSCICFFGGDPGPQILHALTTARLARQAAAGRILRICWETNGAVGEPFLRRMATVSLESGGCIKVDLKAWSEPIHRALCGVSNREVLEHFKILAGWGGRRPEPPLLVASTLLVPGYVDEAEVAGIARFIADLNPDIPYRLLAFHPRFALTDLPFTARSLALGCLEAARRAGVRRVSLGNRHLLNATPESQEE